MKVCKGFEERITDYADGVLPTNLRKETDQHLQQCPGCSTALTKSKNIRKQLRNLPNRRASQDFETVLRTRIRLERSLGRRSFLGAPIRIPAYAAAGVALAMVAFLVFSSLRTDFRADSKRIPPASFSTNESISNGSQTSTNLPQKVNFPMDWMNLADGGTSINSDELNRFSNSRSDSARNLDAREVQNVEF